MPAPNVIRAHDQQGDRLELQRSFAEFLQKANAGELRTLSAILGRWMTIKPRESRDALFGAIVGEFRSVLSVRNIPRG